MKHLALAYASLCIALACNGKECPEPSPDFTPQKNALVALYDWNQDGCVTDPEDLPARKALVQVRGAAAVNGWTRALGNCAP